MAKSFSHITIERFRGIEFLKLSDLSPQLNVFLGKNNVGKTSVLEAIFILTGMSNPSLPLLIHSVRIGSGADISDIRWIFHNADFSQEVCIHSDIRGVALRPLFGIVDNLGDLPISSAAGTDPAGLELAFEIREGGGNMTNYTASFLVRDGEARVVGEEYKEELVAGFLPSNNIRANLLSNFKAVTLAMRKERLVEIVRIFDARVSGIELIGDKIYVRQEGVEQLLPIEVIGDGLLRFVAICTAIINPDNDIILIDEVDNGLHHSVIKLLWGTILSLAKEYGVQVFATTHSKESLQLLSESLLDEDDRVARVFKIKAYANDNPMTAYSYNPINLREAIQDEIEVR